MICCSTTGCARHSCARHRLKTCTPFVRRDPRAMNSWAVLVLASRLSATCASANVLQSAVILCALRWPSERQHV